MNVDFYFDFSCPYAYLASTQIQAIVDRHDATLHYRPMLLGGVFRGLGQHHTPMNTLAPAKARHNLWDMHRFADLFGVPLAMPAGHPLRTVRALRALLSQPQHRWPQLIEHIYQSYWVRGEDISRPEVLALALERAGLDGDARERALAANDDPAIKEELRERTDEALARGIFGAPSIFVDSGAGEPELLWGQDRLHFVELMLGGWCPGDREPSSLVAPVAAPAVGMTVEFYYDVSSPFAYLASTQIEALVANAGAALVWKPMLLGGLFRSIGMVDAPMLAMGEARQRHTARELSNWAAYWGVPFRFTSRFPMRTVTAMRLILAAGERMGELTHLLYRALWVDDQDLADEQVLAALLARGGFSSEALLAAARSSEVKAKLIANTSEAERAGVFGAPTMVVHSPQRSQPALLWGQDRLPLLDAMLHGFWPSKG